MRYSASEKFEIIELVEQSSLSIPRTLAPIGIPEIDVLVHSGQQAPKSPIKRRSRAELAMPLGGIAEILGR